MKSKASTPSSHAFLVGAAIIIAAAQSSALGGDNAPPKPWRVGTPIVTYWAGPTLTDAVAQQMVEGGWNLVWCSSEKDLDIAQRHGLRGHLNHELLTPVFLDDPKRREQMDAFIARVSRHPALYSYHIVDEPSAEHFAAFAKLVAYLRERDPAHLAYINLFPTYATNEQLGNKGETVTAYREHLQQFVDTVKPALLSYDHYHFMLAGDRDGYFLNLDLIRRKSLELRVPFLQIVQACTWDPNAMRVPAPDEMRYLVYTTLAYGAQGISYYVYGPYPGHAGGIADTDGTPTPLYHALKSLNREFVAIAGQLQPLRSSGVYHAGMVPTGTETLPKDLAFSLDPSVTAMEYKPPAPVKGVLLGCFAPSTSQRVTAPTHVVVVNLDYQAEAVIGLRGPSRLEIFDAITGKWTAAKGKRVELRLPRGGGKLVRVRR